jgi:hypothetical protein
LYPGTIICHACLFCADDRNSVLTMLTGRTKPQRMRNYSHVVTRSGRWAPLMKNQKRAIATALLDVTDPPIVAIISLSGQKHLIMRARIWWWQIEESAIRPDAIGLQTLLRPIEALYAAGATKGMIDSGDYSAAFFRSGGLSLWQQHEPVIRSRRGSTLFSLAVWLAQQQSDDQDHE